MKNKSEQGGERHKRCENKSYKTQQKARDGNMRDTCAKMTWHVPTNMFSSMNDIAQTRGGTKMLQKSPQISHLNRGYLPIVKRVLHIAQQQRRFADATFAEEDDFESRRVIVGTCH